LNQPSSSFFTHNSRLRTRARAASCRPGGFQSENKTGS
jgi:hypothetical protein